jgi:hypothetical protein
MRLNVIADLLESSPPIVPQRRIAAAGDAAGIKARCWLPGKPS